MSAQNESWRERGEVPPQGHNSGMTLEQAAESAAWQACSQPRTVTSADEYERLFAEKRYSEKDMHIAADLRAWIEGRAEGLLFSDELRDVDRGRRRNMLLAAGTRAALAYQRENRQPIDSLLIIGLAALCIAEGGHCEVSLARLCAVFRRKRDVMTDAMRRIRDNCGDLEISTRPGGSYSVAVRVMPADLHWTAFDLLGVFAPASTAVAEGESASANLPENPRGYPPEVSGGCCKPASNNPPEKPQGILRATPEGVSGKPPSDPPEDSGATNRNRTRPVGNTDTADAIERNDPARTSSVGTTSCPKNAAPPDAHASAEPIELPFGDLWFAGKHLRIPRTTFDAWCVETPALGERPDFVRNSARTCDDRRANGKANRTFSSPLEWFEANWLPNARTRAIKATNEVAATVPKGRVNGARHDALAGLDPNNFRD
jgi:hypothetical protein